MTAAVAVGGGTFGAPRGARIRSAIGLVYVGVLAGVTLVRNATVENIIRVGIEAAARAVVMSGVLIVLALLVVAVRSARLGIDEDGVSWGWGGFSFAVKRDRIRVCRIYRDAAAVIMRRGSTWYLSGRDYTPFVDVVAALRRAGFPLEEHGRRAPIRARLQAYGVALDVLLVIACAGATLLSVVA
jgi:hypothetical protein